MSISTTHEKRVQAVDYVIRERKTAKILRDRAQCQELANDAQANLHVMLTDIIELAGWAPFHKVVHEKTHRQGAMQSVVPWHFYVLEKPACCTLVDYLSSQAVAQPDSKWSKAWGSKIPKLLAGCGGLIIVTWLPDPPTNSGAPELSENNIEHIAAASAAAQTVLLAAEARSLHSYWSSGGILNDGEVFDCLKIPPNQKLLAAIFLAPEDLPYDENQPGGMRDKRGDSSTWSMWVTLA